MAEAVAGLLTSAFVNIAKDKLGSAIGREQANLLWNFGGDLEEKKDALETISAVLEDAERRSGKEKLVQLCLKQLKDIALDISDVLEDYQDTTDQAAATMPGLLSCLPVAYKKIAMANRMKSLREKLTKIRNEIDNFNFIRGSSTTKEQPYDERETTSNLPEEPLIRRDGEKQEIIKLLSTNTNNNEIVIVPIYGLGGMGKSNLAQLVYNDESFKKYDHRIWVYVSQDFNLNKIGSSIISQLPTEGGQQNIGIQQVIKQCLDNLLQGKEVLIVLNDLWEEKETELAKLRRMLHVKGSKVGVIVTTRKEEIARKVSTSEPYKLRPFEDAICWEIIKRSSRFELKSNKERIEEIGLDIAKKCGDDLSGWTKINSSDIWNGSSEDSDMLPSLKLIYERMPPQLRICFSFCAIFPKGYNIIEDDLVQQWVALGFIKQSEGKEYFNKLLGISFLQVSKLQSTSKEHVVRYTMHDLVHDLVRLTVADELIVFDVAPRRNTRAHKYCRYSLLRKYDCKMKMANMPSKMRALRFSYTGKLLDIPSGAFSFAKCLRTLDFSECSGIFLPASIGQPKQLRCLIAPRVQNDSLPECITELSKLQYLNINGSSQISSLPESIGKLGRLKHLCLSSCSGITKLPESFGDLKSMVHLDMSGCEGIRELPDSIGNLMNLQHLDLSRCFSVKGIPELLCGLTQLQYLNLSSCVCLDRLPEGIGGLMDLQYLNMSSCRRIRQLPESVMKLQNLLHLDLSYCSSMQQLGGVRGLTALQHLDMSQSREVGLEDLSDVLANLTNLKHLSLVNLIISNSEGSGSNVLDWIGGLTNLEHLNLSYNFGLACLPESIGNLKRLHTLDLTSCSKLESLPESIGALGLKSLVLDRCSYYLINQASSLVHFSQTLPDFTVRADDVNGCSNLHMLEGINVSELRIRHLGNVRSLEEASKVKLLDLEEASKVKLLDKHNLLELTLSWTVSGLSGLLFRPRLEDKDLLGQLLPPRGLKHMCLEGYSSTM
ncbi:unnamed protein product [Miscanthus lutarioriparius]|uniref:Uncharacterized protein n=1 Tax=Miscanthus lutarioriparius TaxID=422564 RepID=A0A811QA51_9POAL|nr:unnamed protein product [Miscanthus lutarioriparius]